MSKDFADVEKLLIDYLSANLTQPVHSRVPDPRPTQWMQVRRYTGGAILVRERVDFNVQAWDSLDEVRAMTSLLEARTLLWDLNKTSTLGRQIYEMGETVGPAHADDADSGDLRCFLAMWLVIRTD